MIIGKFTDDGLKIKEVDIPDSEPVFCEVCKKEVKGKSIGERTEFPIHISTKFIFCPDCRKRISRELSNDFLEYENKKVIEWVRKNKVAENK